MGIRVVIRRRRDFIVINVAFYEDIVFTDLTGISSVAGDPL